MHDLAGAWHLVSWSFELDDGRTTHPFGGDVAGLLVYTSDGYMSATLMRRNRPDLGTATLAGAPAQGRAVAAAGYLAYGGPYRIEGDEVVHMVQVSLFPDWVGGEQRRQIVWDGDELILQAATTTASGRRAKNRLRWRRADEGANTQ